MHILESCRVHDFSTSPPRPSTACKKRVKCCAEKLGGRAAFQTACQNSKPLRRRCTKSVKRSPSVPVNPLWTDRGASPARCRCSNLIGCGRDCTARLAHTPRTRPACPACYSVCVLESRAVTVHGSRFRRPRRSRRCGTLLDIILDHAERLHSVEPLAERRAASSASTSTSTAVATLHSSCLSGSNSAGCSRLRALKRTA